MSASLLPLNHPTLVLLEQRGHEYGERATLLMRDADFQIGAQRESTLREARMQIEIAQWHFTKRHERADYSPPTVRWSPATLEALAVAREAESECMNRAPMSRGGFVPHNQRAHHHLKLPDVGTYAA